MRPTLTLATLVMTVLPTSALRADPFDQTVDSLYVRYIHHRPGPVVHHKLAHQLRMGTPVMTIEAEILGSHDYFHHHGHSERAFVRSMIQDVTGRHASHNEIHYWMGRLERVGCNRTVLALEFLQQVRYIPAPVTTYSAPPIYVTPPVRPYVPVYPVVPAPRTGLALSFNLR